MNRIAFLFLAFFFSTSLFAASDVIVYPNDEYDSIQEAIDAASSDAEINTVELAGDVFVLEKSLILRNGVTLKGKDTERSILTADDGWDGQVLLLIAGAGNVRIHNLMFKDADVAIRFENGPSTDVEISNNIFFAGLENKAIEIKDSSSPKIEHNVFYKNDYAISGNELVLYTQAIKHNIFQDNNYISEFLSYTDFSFNCYWPDIEGLAEKDENSLLSDPLFADIDAANHEYDFHLKAASPCIDAGDDSSVLKDALDNSVLDIGAYGGPNASVYPPPVSFKVEESTVDGTNYSMSFRWQPLTAYEVDHADGGYNIYFGSSSNSYEYTSGTQTSPLTDLLVTTSADGENQLTVDGFQSPANDLSSPGSGEITAYNQRLEINWDAVDGATGYQLIYVGGDGDTDTIDVEDVTSYTLSGLSNGVSYSVLIQAYAQPTLYFYIKAFEGLSTNKNESLWYEEFQESVTLGEKVLSDSSLTLSATPDEIRPYPVLPNEGCFIATATYGNYDAEQVQVFRDFRDQFLLTNAIGAQFVQLYYQYGPIAANYLTEHPAYKPAMQALLYPYLLLASAFVEVGVFAGAFFVLMCLGIAGLLVFALFVSSFRWEKRHVI